MVLRTKRAREFCAHQVASAHCHALSGSCAVLDEQDGRLHISQVHLAVLTSLIDKG